MEDDRMGGFRAMSLNALTPRRRVRRFVAEREFMSAQGTFACRARQQRDESGAVLVLALIFMVAVGLIVGGLASWTSNDLKNALNFQSARNAQYALSSTSQLAIQNIRYTPLLGGVDGGDGGATLNASPPSYCWAPTPFTAPPAGDSYVSELTVQNYQVAVWCSTVWNPTSASTRVVTVSACLTSIIPTPSNPGSLSAVQSAATACAQQPGLQTVVTFDDYSASNPTPHTNACSPPPSSEACGSGMTVNSSTIGVANPTVATLSSTQGLVTGGGTLTVTGTGFVANATTVNFVATTATTNIVLAGTSVSVASTTSLSVTIPPTTTQTSFYVIVSTPDGSSPAGSQATYTYQPVVPTVTGITTSSGVATGSAAGGTSVTITGTGFMSSIAGDSTTVNFVDTANPAIVLTAPYVTVNQYVNGVQTMTATTPVITTGTTYYVTVLTAPGGTSAQSAANEFTFQALYPIPGSISPASGPPAGGTSVTVTGLGFVSGATTIQLVPTSGFGANLNISAANISVSSAGTSLTTTMPAATGTTYYVEVTTTWNGTQYASGSSGAPVYTY